jgi:hypothetical protein
VENIGRFQPKSIAKSYLDFFGHTQSRIQPKKKKKKPLPYFRVESVIDIVA